MYTSGICDTKTAISLKQSSVEPTRVSIETTPCFIKTAPFVISSYLCFGSYELHKNFQKYIGGVACCEYGINVFDSLTILC